MKLIFTLLASVGLCFSLFSYEFKRGYDNSQTLEVTLPQDQRSWEKSDDIKSNSGFNYVSYQCQDNESHEFSVEYNYFNRIKPEAPLDKIWNFKELVFSDYVYENAFQLMKDLRKHLKRSEGPYVQWKLISAKEQDDIIFEKRSPSMGPYKKFHELVRIIKGDSGFFVIKIKNSSDHFDKATYENYLAVLKNGAYKSDLIVSQDIKATS